MNTEPTYRVLRDGTDVTSTTNVILPPEAFNTDGGTNDVWHQADLVLSNEATWRNEGGPKSEELIHACAAKAIAGIQEYERGMLALACVQEDDVISVDTTFSEMSYELGKVDNYLSVYLGESGTPADVIHDRITGLRKAIGDLYWELNFPDEFTSDMYAHVYLTRPSDKLRRAGRAHRKAVDAWADSQKDQMALGELESSVSGVAGEVIGRELRRAGISERHVRVVLEALATKVDHEPGKLQSISPE